jgi:hypothetical protein
LWINRFRRSFWRVLGQYYLILGIAFLVFFEKDKSATIYLLGSSTSWKENINALSQTFHKDE